MQTEVIIELVRLIPSVLWFIFAIVLVAVLYTPFRREFLPRLTGFSAFGVEAKLIREELDKAVRTRGVEVPESERSQVLRRAQRSTQILQGAKILWVDDNPENFMYERNVLQALGVGVDLVKTTEGALSTLLQTQYHLVISDMTRQDKPDEGLILLREMRKRGMQRPLIFFTASYDPEKGIPPHSFGITNRSDELLHLVMDALERERA